MNTVRGLVSFGFVCCVALLIGTWLSAESFAQTPDKASAFVGAWTLNKDLSEAPQSNGASNDNGSPNNGRGGGGGGRGGRGRGGFGGGGRNGGFGAGGGSADPDATARMRETIRDIRNPPDHLTIVATDTMVVLTGPDGRATRLSPDGTKIKDESTNIERKTKWDGEKLVSEMNGPGLGKTTETYTVDREHHQLHLLAEMEGGGGRPARKFSHVYDLDAR